MVDAPFTLALELVLAAMLIVAAVIDVRTFTISNRLNLAVAALALPYWWAVGLDPWPGIAVQIGMAVAVFLVLAAAFWAGMMGGGDVKLAAALALWFPPAATVKFLIFMSIAGGLLTVIVLVAHRMRGREGRPEIPYGVAIAAGGLAILAQRFLNHFA
jgi:prepilin peptidase CpaA